MSKPPDPQSPPGTDARDVLAEVLDDQARREARRTAASARAVPRKLGYPAVILLAAASVWLWVAPPAVVTPEPPPPLSSPVLETGLRMDMWVVAGSVERARSPDGSVPRTLEGVLEDPEDAEDIRYVVLGAREYMLVGERMGTAVRWTSSEGMAALSSVPAESLLQESSR